MTTNRTVLTIDLKPVVGDRFQTTGFPDLGPALYEAPDGNGNWVQALLVESPQSMANRLEGATWDEANQTQVDALDGVPYVQVINANGEFVTSSRREAHRLASAYILDGTIDGEPSRDVVEKKLGLVKGSALDHRTLAHAIFDLDPLSLIHGVFFAQKPWPWQPKIARAVTASVEARDVKEVVSGGVKTDVVDPKSSEGKGAAEGYGMVPHSRTEHVAQTIQALVTIDHEQLRSYGLGDDKTELLEAIVQYELARLFGQTSLRLRTACDLTVVDVESSSGDYSFDLDAATSRVKNAIGALNGSLGAVTDVLLKPTGTKKK